VDDREHNPAESRARHRRAAAISEHAFPSGDAFAMLSRGDLRLVLSAPGAGPGGGQAMPDGTAPEPEDPSGNPVELFEPTRDEAKLSAAA
jgi:hypothetical protein